MKIPILTAIVAAPILAFAQLHAIAKDAGLLYFGTAVRPWDSRDTAYYELQNDINNWGQFRPDNAQKWDATEPSRGKFSYSQADAIVERALSNKMLMRCHTLVWYSQLPSWVSSGSWTNDTMTAVMESHISNVVGHFKGNCYAWDVINEALEDDGTYRNNPFLKALGDSYFALSFKFAAAADPVAKLYYNDYNLEYFPAKADGAVRIAKLVQEAGVPIHGVGLQAHMTVGRTPTRENLTWTLNKYTALGLDVAYTELDIRIKPLPSNASSLEAQAKEYEWIVGSCLDVPRCVGITVWGYGDSHSWIPQTFPGAGDACLYDKNSKPKPAFSSVSALLASASGKRAPWGATSTLVTTTAVATPTPTSTVTASV